MPATFVVLVGMSFATSCDGEDGGTGQGTTTAEMPMTSTGEAMGGSSSSSSGGAATTAAPTTTSPPPASDSSSTGESLPEGPLCSVQVTTHGELFDPLPRGKTEDAFPPAVADALEDRCGCHTLMNNGQNVEHGALLAPGGTLWLTLADLEKPFKGGTLVAAMADEVAGLRMPPGSCAFPSEAAATLQAWFDAGHPSGAAYPPR